MIAIELSENTFLVMLLYPAQINGYVYVYELAEMGYCNNGGLLNQSS